jgi:hypothetical protein
MLCLQIILLPECIDSLTTNLAKQLHLLDHHHGVQVGKKTSMLHATTCCSNRWLSRWLRRAYTGIVILYIHNHTHNVVKHSVQVHSALATLSVTARQAMHGGNQQTRQRNQGILHNMHMFISGHAQANPEATFARLSKHAYRGTI